MSLLESLRADGHVIAAELRPPRAELTAAAGMDAWIDTYHAVRSLVRRGTHVFLTDSAVGLREEDNLRHLIINLGTDVTQDRVVPLRDGFLPLLELLPDVRGHVFGHCGHASPLERADEFNRLLTTFLEADR